ncbi:hypothetical protein HAP41_0000045220 [Bradyrhizobium barranii subsp. apii]|uniref:Uncharacterized protein n=1 Tax=Bradyrhizobium barranii subsp. apii TaxID=2819348 RepID=A0A8T5V907_9BRAD|nr:hypothetical protein [Bradyrhizobium barranii]UPT87256.1 hypothetical protein HAP41_0000045220 [Bradyrhizobium barranii subsp. apii]
MRRKLVLQRTKARTHHKFTGGSGELQNHHGTFVRPAVGASLPVGRSVGPLGAMLPIVERGQSMDGTLAQLVGIAFAVACCLHNSPGNDFPIYLQLADVLKRSTCQVVRCVHGGYLLWING